MAKIAGSLREVAIAKETSRGTAASSFTGKFVRHNNYAFNGRLNKAQHNGANSTIHQTYDAEIVQEWSDGNLEMILDDVFMGDIANMIMGQDPVTTGAGDPYTHNWTLAQNNAHTAYSIYVESPNKTGLVSPLTMLNTATISVAPNEYVTASLDFLGGKQEAASHTASYGTPSEKWKPDQVEIKLAGNYAGLSGASALPVENFEINVEKNVAPYFTTGATELQDSINQRVSISGSFSLAYGSATRRDLYFAGTDQALSLTFSNTGDSRSMTFEIPTIAFTNWNEDADNDAYVTESIEFIGTGLDETNGLIKMTVVDGESSH